MTNKAHLLCHINGYQQIFMAKPDAKVYQNYTIISEDDAVTLCSVVLTGDSVGHSSFSLSLIHIELLS